MMCFSWISQASQAKRVLMLLNEGFQPVEYYTPRSIFEKEGFIIKAAARYPGVVSPAKKYTEYDPVKVDLTFDMVNLDEFDVVVFVGGGGAWEDYFPNQTVHKLLTEALINKKMPTALICAATGLLGTANNLNGTSKPIAEGKHVTGPYLVEGLLKVLGKTNFDPGLAGQPHVVVDGNLITGRDPESAELFAKTIVKVLRTN